MTNLLQLPIRTTEQLKREIERRASTSGLSVNCSSDGSINSRIAIVAEAPGESEVSKGIPLIGGSGQLLWRTLRNFGIARHDCYITNVSKRQVSFGSDKRRPMNKHEQDLWNNLLLWELSQLPNLRYVVALGNFALSALCGKEGITHWRGSVLDAEIGIGHDVKVICTYNPAMVLREPKTEITFNLDCSKIRKVMEGKHRVPEITTHIYPTTNEVVAYIEALVEAGQPVSYDIEVVSMETACVGIANSGTEAMCIAFRSLGENVYTVPEEIRIRRALQEMLTSPKVRLIAQNNMFDSVWLWYKDKMHVQPAWFDTMLAHHTLYPSLPHNLGFLTTQYTDHPYYKDERQDWREGGNIDDFWRYNAKDCCITWAVHRKLLRELEKSAMDRFFFDHVMRLQPHLARMTVGGMRIDLELKERIRAELIEDVNWKLGEFHRSVHEATGIEDYQPNPKSPAQLGSLLFGKLKLIGRGSSTNAENRKRMLAHPRTGDKERAVLHALNGYAKEQKFLSTYAEMKVDPDGRARSEYNQRGVASTPGRLSSHQTLWGSGMNFQNQPVRALPMFIADPGYGFVYFDMEQIEARIVAVLAGIDTWIEQFERARLDGSYDAHRALASDLFKVPYDETPASDIDAHGNYSIRYKAKRCRHGLNYRMEAPRLAETAGIPLTEAYKLHATYHRITPQLRKWWAALEREVRTHKVLYNAFGRRLMVLERITPEALENIVAFKPQSTNGDHVCRVMYQCEDDSRWPRTARLALNVHDALVAMCKLEDQERCLSIMKKYAEQPIVINGFPLIVPAGTKLSVADEQGIHRWSTLKKHKIEAAA